MDLPYDLSWTYHDAKGKVSGYSHNYAISKLVQWSQDVEHKHGACFINLDNEPISPRVNGHYLMPEGLDKAPLFSILFLSQTFPHLNFSQGISIPSQIATLTTLNQLGLKLLHGVLRYEILSKLQKCQGYELKLNCLCIRAKIFIWSQ